MDICESNILIEYFPCIYLQIEENIIELKKWLTPTSLKLKIIKKQISVVRFETWYTFVF